MLTAWLDCLKRGKGLSFISKDEVSSLETVLILDSQLGNFTSYSLQWVGKIHLDQDFTVPISPLRVYDISMRWLLFLVPIS